MDSMSTGQVSEMPRNDAGIQVVISHGMDDPLANDAAQVEQQVVSPSRINRRRKKGHWPSRFLSALERLSLVNCIGNYYHHPDKPFDPEKTACMYFALLLLWLILGVGTCCIVFSTLYVGQTRGRYDVLRSTCKAQANHLLSEFTVAINQIQVMSDVVSSFYLNDPDFLTKGQLYQTLFQDFWERSTDTRPLVAGVGFVTVVREDQREDFEKRFFKPLADFVTGGHVGLRETYYPLTLADPIFSATLGVDMYTFPGNDEVFSVAQRTGKLTLSLPVPPVPEVGDRGINVLLLLPTYRSKPPVDASIQLLNNLTIGYIGADFQIAEFFKSVSGPGKDGDIFSTLADVTDPSHHVPVLPGRNETDDLGPAGMRSTYKYTVPLPFKGVNRRYEVWCNHMGRRPFPILPVLMMCVSIGATVLVTEMILATHARFRDAGEEVRRMEIGAEAMREAKVAAQSADNAKSQFLAVMSHEIRTPLNGVLGMMSLLADTKMTPMQADCVQTACSSGKALLSLINDVLDLSKIEAGRMDLENVVFDIRDLVDDVLSVFSEKAREKNLQIAALVHRHLPSMVTGDLNRLRQILINLMGNAIKYTERGHVFLCVRASDAETPTPHQSDLSKRAGSYLYSRPPTFESRGHDSQTLADGERPARQIPVGRAVVRCSPFLQRLWQAACLHSTSIKWSTNPSIAPRRKSTTPPSFRSSTTAYLAPTSPLFELQSLDQGQSPISSSIGIGEITLSGLPVADHVYTWPRIASWLEMQAEMGPLLEKAGQTPSDALSLGNPPVLSPLSLVFSIQDTGNGIKAEAQGRIFKPFMQEDNTTARRFGGTGIGLSISRKLAHLMGGDLSFVSRHTVGSTFTCHVKLNQKRTAGNNMRDAIVEKGIIAEWESKMKNLTLILVDKNILRSKVVETYLLQLDMRMLLATDLHEASVLLSSEGRRGSSGGPSSVSAGQLGNATVADQALSQRPRAVLLEWSSSWLTACPEALWLKLQDAIWQKDPQLPVVLLMDRVDPSLRTIAERASAEGRILTTLLKPLRRSSVVVAMAEALRLDMGRTSASTPTLQVTSPASIERLLKGRRFLVVDDNMVNRKVASKFLTKYGVEVDCVEGGAEALDRLLKAPPIEAILMDIQMPCMDGYECSKHIREMEKEGKIGPPAAAPHRGGVAFGRISHIPIIAMTADVLKGTREKCMLSGMDGYLTKPMDPARLYEAVGHFFRPVVD